MTFQQLPIEYWALAGGVAIFLAIAGYVIATMRKNKEIGEINGQLSEAVDEVKRVEGLNHAQEVQQGKLQEKLAGLIGKNEDLVASHKERLQELNGELAESRRKLDSVREEAERLAKQARGAEVKAQETESKYQDLKSERDRLQQKHDNLQESHQRLSAEFTELKTTLEQKEEHFSQQMAQLTDAKQALTKEFENLANKIFEEKGRTFTDTSKSSIDQLLKPFREQIQGFQSRINEVHDASLKGNTALNAEIHKVLEIGLKMSAEANNLTSALKGDSQQRGAWGEAQLKRTLEMSGLIEDAHYETQSSFEDTEGKRKQTDYLIKLPDNKHIIIDSKVSLVAYDKAVSAESPEEFQLAMVEHVKAVKRHIDDLASKDYTNLVGVRSPNFVLMFMPIEPAYIDALKSNKDLFSYGYEKGIVLVSHTTLIPILRTVANLWMMERSNAEAREISAKAGEIYNQVCLVAERLQKLGGTLNTVSGHYNNTVKALVGQQGLHGKVERFAQISSKVTKSMPKMEAATLDFETERLSFVVEAIDEEPAPPQLEHVPADSAGEEVTNTEVEETN
ncbi:DNA recombination protein RmuC [Microbulbifer pacificus]|uniref:DNA recombination protein RmuC n=1 Tax=Microbulbifer pacificus TaxID=407164 RepID=A0AAU0MZE6_9GAMM|nr:DNA recombination protein RmuC [Microbulbifer pacificus]WOX05965.1 DNA recombination protein RmuC [Microbulbifer pacificus]